jgi:uncharacterized protein YrzB (UPF0473 family)
LTSCAKSPYGKTLDERHKKGYNRENKLDGGNKMSEKELDMNELEPDRVTLTDEEGVEREFDIIGTLQMDGNDYFALVAVDGNEDEYIVLKAIEEDGEEVLVTIDDDDEFDRVADAFDNEMMEEIDLDENN